MTPLIYHPIYSQLPLPEGHRYPIHKYQLLYSAVKHHMDSDPKWGNAFEMFQPMPVSVEQVKQVHDGEYVDLLVSGNLPAAKMRRIGFPWSEQLIERTLYSSGGTCLAAEMAIESGLAIHLSGGYHHAHRDFGSGFCLLNDLVLAAKHALTFEHIDKVLIVDSDVHHGDGTATLCQENDDIITLSFHCDKNFPARKPVSDLDVPLSRETEDEEFLRCFEQVTNMAIAHHQPDLIIYDAGVDIHQDDELGYLNISTQGIFERDCLMLNLAKSKAIPMACVVGGGYRSEHKDLVPIHMQLLNAALAVNS
ncbi:MULTISPECIES: histone deacetylase family protein [Vibrio]|uniref:Histone deacetylase n=1 Tax=Vibrio lentus TaxID=136468 RepID=A0A1B9QIW9_9VIBR|nr:MULTISPECIES: histone deacetylase [Vibrio]OCH64066.1 histone deacetylase [Vibrio lentus]PME52942.1 histone deacetylase [Vibrio lentus]PME62947.1 histone deacetylase [Vibrio lentus]PME81999.1 histone deacetylase [Vibrio lentus]PMH94606.1 histone deacetylase [Vibrio lentus]